MQIDSINSYSGLTKGDSALHTAKLNGEKAFFSDLIERLTQKNESNMRSTVSTSKIVKEGRLSGDISSGFENTFTLESDKHSLAKGAAANQANLHVQNKTIDKTSKLYEKSMELESFFVKQMLSAMRKTVSKSSLSGEGLGGQMYEDMLFDEYATSMTKNAGFGLADQIYLSLV